MLRLLLWQRAVASRNELLRGTWRRRLGWLAGVVIGIVFVYFVFMVSLVMFEFLLERQPSSVPGLITGGFTLLSTFALFWGVGAVLADMYLSSDLELLLAAPVSTPFIFWLKLLSAMWQSAAPAMVPMASLVGYGIAARATLSYYLGVAMVMLVLLALLAGISMSLVMLLMRVMPARRAREIYSLLYVVFFAALWLGWMLLSRGGSQGFRAFSRFTPQVAAAGSQFSLPPASWAGHLMLAWARGDWAQVGQYGLLIASVSAVAVGLAFWLFERSFHRDWATMQEVAGRARPRANGNGSGRTVLRASPGQRLAAWLPSPAREIAGKDWIILPRDLRQLSRMIMPLVVSLFYVYQFGFASSIPRELPQFTFWLMLAILPIVPLFFALALAAPAIGKEAANFELLRVAPISPSGLLWGKVMMAAVPTAFVGAIVTVAVAVLLHLPASQVLALFLLICLFSVSMSLVAVALGALTPNFRATDYRRSVGPLASYGTMVGSGAIWFVTLATVAVIAIRLPANQGLAAILRQNLNPMAAYLLLSSPWPLIAVLVFDLLVAGGVAVLWGFANRRMAAWQPND